MQNKKINLFIADNSGENKSSIAAYFEEHADFEIIGQSHDAYETLEVLKKKPIDVLVMDVILAGMDGFEFIEKAKKELGGKMPKIIITSCLSHNGFVNKALQIGASYFMFKPIEPATLESRIRDVLGLSPAENPANKELQFKNMQTKVLEEKISNIFITVGIPAHIKGYQFLREAIKMAIEKPDIINSITKRLYPSIAERFTTSSSKVERAIRHAIEVAWNRGKIENINNIFGIKVYSQNEKPTNGEFIALVADKMLIEGA